MPNDAGAPRGAALIAELDALSDHDFSLAWTFRVSQEEKDALPAPDRARFIARKVSVDPHSGKASRELERALVRAQAAITSQPITPTFPRLWLDDARFDPDSEYFIKGLFAKGRLIVVYGPSGEGKTFWTIDAVSHAAAGIEYRHRRVRRALWVYVAAEAGGSITPRFYGWATHRLSDTREGRIPLAIITRGVNLLNPVEVEALLIELRTISTEIGLPVGGIVFDTLSRSTPGGDENSAEDMTRAVGVADLIRDELNGASTIFVHHSGKDAGKGARGHSSLHSAADTVISVMNRVATIEKSRDGATGDQFPFDLEVIELGQDQDGDAITTCIVIPTQETTQKAKPARLSPDEQLALDALREEIGASGQPMPETSVIPNGVRAVRVEKWRQRFHSRIGDSRDLEQNAKRQAWHRGRKGLISKHIATCWEDFAWLS